ncbi:L,D-transpeptidase [Allostreptomyces psammosilenae]|nr:Ig-like domain-containing protein [Allostreptomyces psammosilenae]
MITACSGGGASSGGAGGSGGGSGAPDDGSAEATVSTAVLAITPEDGSDNVATDELKVSVRDGELTSVEVTDAEGNEVEGELSEDGATWQPVNRLANGTEYHVTATAEDAAGLEAAQTATFTTVTAADTFIGFFTPEDGSTVGVGMPVSINFNREITNQADVEQHITVTAEPEVEIAPHWFSSTRLDFRPEEYWEPGTKVTLSLRLSGVEGAEGIYGTQSKDVSFTIGRSQISTVDAEAHTMVVERDGEVLREIPISAGSPETPTYNGIMVISEKHEVTRMNGDTVGFGGEYDIPDVPYAMRLSTSGTFVHGNYWSSSDTFGSANVSHGCVGLEARQGGGGNTPAQWFYEESLLGDVLIVKNSDDVTIAPDNGLNGWNMPWDEWVAGSAL